MCVAAAMMVCASTACTHPRSIVVVCRSMAFFVPGDPTPNPTITVLSCPGQYDSHEGSVTGPDAINYLGRFNANRAVIGASGITLEGPNDVHSSAVAVKRAMLARSQEHILLLDHSKFEMPNLEVVCPLGEIHRLVTDQAPAHELASALGKAKVEILY